MTSLLVSHNQILAFILFEKSDVQHDLLPLYIAFLDVYTDLFKLVEKIQIYSWTLFFSQFSIKPPLEESLDCLTLWLSHHLFFGSAGSVSVAQVEITLPDR